MSDIILTQTEADALIALEKHRTKDELYSFPLGGGVLRIPLHSPNRREQFLIDINRGKIDLLKGTYQNRARQTVVLVRLDFGGAPHRNPDGEEIFCPHLHVYREHFGDKWAIAASSNEFGNISDLWQTIKDFMKFCNVTQPPNIERGLFI